MLKANFKIKETGGSGIVLLQSSADTGMSWQNVGSSLTLTQQGELQVDDSTDITIDTSVYLPNKTYKFRLIDKDGTPISNIVSYLIPSGSDTHSLSVQGYTYGTSGFKYDGASVMLYATPSSMHTMNSATNTVTSYDYEINFYAGGVKTLIGKSVNVTTDQLVTVGINGAGVYHVTQGYACSDGTSWVIGSVIQVGPSGAYLADVSLDGISTMSSISGTTFSENPTTGGTFSGLDWYAVTGSGSVFLASGNSPNLTLPAGTQRVMVKAGLYSTFTDDFNGELTMSHPITLS